MRPKADELARWQTDPRELDPCTELSHKAARPTRGRSRLDAYGQIRSCAVKGCLIDEYAFPKDMSTPRVPLSTPSSTPSSTPRVPLEFPSSLPRVPIEYPSSTPSSTPRVPLEYPSSTHRVPLQYPSSTPPQMSLRRTGAGRVRRGRAARGQADLAQARRRCVRAAI
jgi:hypothetical protein